MDIKNRLERLSDSDRVYFGKVIEDFMQSEAYELLKVITQNEITNLLTILSSDQHNPNGKSDKYLGQLCAYQKILNDIEGFVKDRDALLEKRRKERTLKEEETDTNEEPQPKYEGAGGVV